jgi:hypothetical protein
MTLTEFWEWMLSCKELDEPRRARIIFFTKQQAKTYRTASAGTIPLNIAKSQKDFFTSFNYRNTDNTSNTNSMLQESKELNVPFTLNYKSTGVGSNSSETQGPMHSYAHPEECAYNRVHMVNCKNNGPTTREPPGSGLLCIQELDKLRSELLDYNLASPDALEIETGAIIEKINNIRELLGITC